jgi:hypothetical protein
LLPIVSHIPQDKIAAMVGDISFKIKPRLGDYVLLNRNQVNRPCCLLQTSGTHRKLRISAVLSLFMLQGHLSKTTLFPCPHPVLGKGKYVHLKLSFFHARCSLIINVFINCFT